MSPTTSTSEPVTFRIVIINEAVVWVSVINLSGVACSDMTEDNSSVNPYVTGQNVSNSMVVNSKISIFLSFVAL